MNHPLNNIHRKPAFTLIEVMLSVFLMVLLLLGINYIFTSSAEAISAGQAYGEFNRGGRAAQPILFNDLYNIDKNGPFIIVSRTAIQFLNAPDAASSTDVHQIPTDNNGTTATLIPALYNFRSHRVDMIDFVAHTLYQRRTADDPYYTNFTFGNDIFVQIGHGKMPSTDYSTYYGPDDMRAPQTVPPSVTGAYATDWTLLRSAILFKDPNNVSIDTNTYTASHPWQPEFYYPHLNNSIYYSTTPSIYQTYPAPYLINLTPLSPGVTDTSAYTPINNPSPSHFGDSRFDMVGVTLEQFRQLCTDAAIMQRNYANLAVNSRYPLWCSPLLYFCPNLSTGDPTVTKAATYDPITGNLLTAPQWDWKPNAGGHDSSKPIMNRFNCNPSAPAPLTASAVAQSAPFFIQHCTQFVVEYAGDYLTQSADGTITGAGSDNQVDYFVDGNGNKHIRWYGLPRKTTLTGTGIRGYNPGVDTNSAATTNAMQDVIPLSDYLSLINGYASGSRTFSTFEVDCNFAPCGDYAGSGTTFIGNDTTNYGKDSRYACAWLNDTPAMVRILMKVDDPNDKVKDGPWYEFVFKLK